LAGIPQNFQAFSNVLANYNFVDIASGTGYINFYAGITVDKNLLSNFSFYSDYLWSYLPVDYDFDTVMNRPLDVKGLGIVNVPCFVDDGDTGTVTVTLRKVSDGVETDIVTNNSSTANGGGVHPGKYFMLAIDLDVPLTHFKIGDTLRLTILGNASISRIAFDPKNRTSDGTLSWDSTGAVPSQLSFQCPVRLNL
jgi:hypothetical protein